mgnify:CR=1 FL=1
MGCPLTRTFVAPRVAKAAKGMVGSVVLDMGDKFAKTQGFARQDEALKANAVHARMIAKQHKCAIFYMSQLSAEAEGKIILNQSMMEGSRTGKAAEADLMILIAKNGVYATIAPMNLENRTFEFLRNILNLLELFGAFR